MLSALGRTRALRLCALLALSQGCRCSALSGELGSQSFTRCVQADPPAERKLRMGARTLSVVGRMAELTGALPVRIAAFTGPVGGSLTHTDAAELAAQKPGMVWVLGGLGDDLQAATASLAALAGLGVPVLLIPGGADRLALLQEAMAGLSAGAADSLLLAAGLHELRIGKTRFAIVSGAPDGRYAIDAEACGFVPDDLAAVGESLRAGAGRPYLISWAAPSGSGLTNVPGAGDIGSPALAAWLASSNARGGVFAWPEGTYRVPDPAAEPLVSLVPRLGRTGTLAEGGGRLARGVLMLHVTDAGLLRGP